MLRRHNKAQRVQRKIDKNDDQREYGDVEDKVYVDKGVRGWKIIFLLPYNKVWSTIVLLMSICAVYKGLYDASLELSQKKITGRYLFAVPFETSNPYCYVVK